MFKRSKIFPKKQIKFDYQSLNPFAESFDNKKNSLNRIKDDKTVDENEWRIEYELIYRSYQLEK